MSSAASSPVIGSTAAARVVRSLALAEDGPQVVLFYGEGGGDTHALADLLVRSWLCPQEKAVGGCGECPVCRAAATGRAVDFQRIAPYGPGRLIRLGAVEYMPNESDPKFTGIPTVIYFRTRPLMARAKVVWFDPADRLGVDSAHALLKTLEELPDYGRVVMTTDDLGRVMPTIRSRCLCVACDLPADLESLVGPMGEAEQAFARTAGDVHRIRQAPDEYAELLSLFRRTLVAGPGLAPALAEDARALAARLGDEGARQGQLVVLELLAAWWTGNRPDDPAKTSVIVEAHRLVAGNVGAGAVFDMVFARLLV